MLHERRGLRPPPMNRRRTVSPPQGRRRLVLGDHRLRRRRNFSDEPYSPLPLGPHVVLELVVAPREQLAQLVPRAARAMEERDPLLPCIIHAIT